MKNNVNQQKFQSCMTNIPHKKNDPILQKFPRFFLGKWTILSGGQWSSVSYTLDVHWNISMIYIIAKRGWEVPKCEFGGITKKNGSGVPSAIIWEMLRRALEV